MTTRRSRPLPLAACMLLIALLVVPMARPARAQTETTVARPDLQRVLDAMTSDSVSGALVRVVDERGIWTGVSGLADLGKHRPVPPNGRFRVGSVTKSFVSAVLLQLVAEGRLTLEDTVERWLPGLVPGGNGITVRQLLSHTSGIFNFTDDQEAFPLLGQRFLDEIRFRTFTPVELVRIATAHDPYFPPGGGWTYSNTNYILAGLVIEQVTGHPYGLEIGERILKPLELRHTYLPGVSTGIPGPHSHGYLIVYDGDKVRTVDVTELNPSWASSAGEIISTTEDLDRFYTALLGGDLLHPSELAAMQTTVDAAPGMAYGLGLFRISLPCGVTVWGHTGGIHGYVTTALQTADGQRRFVASFNPLLDRAGNRINELVLTEFCGAAMAGAPAPSLRVAAAIR